MNNGQNLYLVLIRHEKSEKTSASSFFGRKISTKVRDSQLFPIDDKR